MTGGELRATTERTLPTAVRAVLEACRAGLARRFGDRVQRVTLFGSMARGEAHEDSDVDVLVVLDALGPGERSRAIELGAQAGFDAGLVITPVVLSRAEWDDLVRRERLFAREIERDGIEA